MFENSVFDEQRIRFRPEDRFYFFTDGLDFIFSDEGIDESFINASTITEFKKNLSDAINDKLTDAGRIADDCTLLALEIK